MKVRDTLQSRLEIGFAADPEMWKGAEAEFTDDALATMPPVAGRGEVPLRLEVKVHPHPLGN
jgi:hypothetical protein